MSENLWKLRTRSPQSFPHKLSETHFHQSRHFRSENLTSRFAFSLPNSFFNRRNIFKNVSSTVTISDGMWFPYTARIFTHSDSILSASVEERVETEKKFLPEYLSLRNRYKSTKITRQASILDISISRLNMQHVLRLVGSEDPEVQIAAATTIRHIRKLALTAEKFHINEVYVTHVISLFSLKLIASLIIMLNFHVHRNTLSETDHRL